MDDIDINLEELKLEETVFKDVKYYVSGHVQEKILEILRLGGAERMNYFSDYVTHVVCGIEPDENDLTDATDVYEIPVVTCRWVITCARVKKLISTKGFKYDLNQLFSGLVFCFSKLGEDKHALWSLITYNGGIVNHNFTHQCTHLVTADLKSQKFLKASIFPDKVKIVTPDWVIESVKIKNLAQTELYHPKLLTWPKPRESTALITGFEQDDTEKISDIPETESTQALLDQLKQRMPWNQPSTPTTTSSSSFPSFLSQSTELAAAKRLPWTPSQSSTASSSSSAYNFNPNQAENLQNKRLSWNQQQNSNTFQSNPASQPDISPVKTSMYPGISESHTDSTVSITTSSQQQQQQLQQHLFQQQRIQQIRPNLPQTQQQFPTAQPNTSQNNQVGFSQLPQPITSMQQQGNQLPNRQFIGQNQQHMVQNANQSQYKLQGQIGQPQIQNHAAHTMQPQANQQMGMVNQQQPMMHGQPQLVQNQRITQQGQLSFGNQSQVAAGQQQVQFQIQGQQQPGFNQRGAIGQEQLSFGNQNQIPIGQQGQNQMYGVQNQTQAGQFALQQQQQQQKVQQQRTQLHPNWQQQQQQQQLGQQQQLAQQQIGQQQITQQQIGQQQLAQQQLAQQQLGQQQSINQQQLSQQQQLGQQQLGQQGLNQQQLAQQQQLNQQQLGQQQLNQPGLGQQQQVNQQQLSQQSLNQQQLTQQGLNQQQLGQQPQLNQQQLGQQQQLTQQGLNQQQLTQQQLTQQQLAQQGLSPQQQLNPQLNQQQLAQQGLNQQPQLTPQLAQTGLNQQPQLTQQQLAQQQINQQQLNAQQLNTQQLNQQHLTQQQLQQQQLQQQQLNQQQLNSQQLTPQQLQQRQQLAQQQLQQQQQLAGPQPHLVQQQLNPQQLGQQHLVQQQINVQRHAPNTISTPRLANWSPNQQQGAMPQRQLIHLDAQTHQQLQQMDPTQRALFVAKLQKQRQLLLHRQQMMQQPRGGHIAVIRGGMPQGLTPQQQMQWLQQQQSTAKPQPLVLPQVNAVGAQHAPGLSPIAQPSPVLNDPQSQHMQIQRQQFQRLQQLHIQREQAQKQQMQQVQAGTIVRPPLAPQEAPPVAVAAPAPTGEQTPGAAPQQQLVVNAKTKTALANMLSIRLQSGGGNIAPVDGEPSAAGTLRLMTAQHNAALNQIPARPQDLLAMQQQRRTLGNITNATGELPRAPPPPPVPTGNQPAEPNKQQFSPGRVLPPPQHRHGPFYGHNPNLKLPPDLFLLGCIFVVVEVERYLEETSPDWRAVIEKHGGEVEPIYCSRVTHVLCETQRHGVVMQALRDLKRCVTLFWLDDVVKRKQVVPPWQALHLPTGYMDGAPAIRHLICLSGFTGNDRSRVRDMIKYTGAKFTSYFSRHNTILVCAKAEGVKYQHAKRWGTPVVNVLWLTDLMLGNFSALNQIEHVKYQQFSQPVQFGFDTALVPNLMFAWKMPINISQESYERVKRSPSPVVLPQKAKKPRLDTPPVSENEISSKEMSPTHRILFSLYSDKDRKSLEKIVMQLGGSVAKSHEDATHLVMPHLGRSTKLLFAITMGSYIVPDTWLKESQTANKFLDESTYRFDTKEFNATHDCDFYKTLETKNRDKLFQNKVFFLTPSVVPSYKVLKELIEKSGGTVEKQRRSLGQIEAANNSVPYSYIILTNENDLHVVYDCLRKTKGSEKQKYVGSSEVVMMAVLRQSFPFDQFLVRVY